MKPARCAISLLATLVIAAPLASWPAPASAAKATETPIAAASPTNPLTQPPHPQSYPTPPIGGNGKGQLGIFPRNPKKEAPPRRQRAQSLPRANTAVIGGSWTPLGPAPVVDERCCGTSAPSSYGNASGRITSLVTDPTNAAVIYAGTAGGGIWKSSTGGTSWSPLTDNQASLAIGALAIDPTGQVIFAGTGEDNLSDSQAGQGILKSINAGSTWTLLGQSTFAGHHIGAIAIDRTNTSHVFAATDIGLYVSADGGSSWTQNTAYLASLRTVPPASGGVFQILQDPVTATKYWLVAADFCLSELGDILTGDGGSTWTNVTPALLALSRTPAIRLGLGLGSDGTAYAIAADCNGNLLDVAKSTNGAASWTEFSGVSNYFNLSGGATGQGGYDNVVAVDPANSAHAVFAGVTILATSDGLSTFSDIGRVYSGGFIHPDFHALTFTGLNTFYAGNDGGVFLTTDLGGTGASSDWTNLNTNLATIQFWRGTALDTTHMLGGAQDNGSPGNLPGSSALPAWQDYHGGDGTSTAIDPTSGSTTIYASYHNLVIEKGGSTLTTSATSPYDSFVPAAPCSVSTDPACSDPTNFLSPFLMDAANPLRLLADTNKVYQTTDGGVPAGTSSWTAISADLTTGTTFGPRDSISAMVIGPAGATNVVMTGSLFGKVSLSTNATGTSATWSDITGTLPPFPGTTSPNFNALTGWISGVAVNPLNPAEAWVSIGGLNVGHVWHTTTANSGASTIWSDISGSLPNAVMDGILLDPRSNSAIYVATDFGVMVCTTCGGAAATANWAILGTGLPNVKVSAISIMRDNSTLIAWTHGRGAWEIPLPAPVYVAGVDGTDNGLWVLRSGSANFVSEGGVMVSAPAIVAVPQTSGAAVPLYIATGSDHNLWVRNDTAGWQPLTTSPVYCLDNPAGVIIAGTLWVACEGSDNALWYATTTAPTGTGLPTISASAWQSAGGVLTAGPAISSVGGAPTVFVLGTGGQVWMIALVKASAGWVAATWVCVGHPAAVSVGSTTYFACHGTDNALWYASNNGSGWSTAQSLGGVLVDGAGIANTSLGPIFFAEGTDGALWQRSLTAGWSSDGGQINHGASAAGL